MSANPAVQVTFDHLMNHASHMGSMLADTVLAGAPPPWEESWFEQFYSNAVEQAGVVFKTKWPEASETIIANMQVRFCDGLETRFKEVLGGGSFIVPYLSEVN